MKDGFSGINLQFSEYCQVLLLSASTWQRTGFNPKSKATSIVRAQFSLQTQAFHCLPSFHAICTRPFPWRGAACSSPGLGSAWSTGREAELSACKQKHCVTGWELFAFSDEDDSNSTSCDDCAGKISSGGRSEPQVHPFLLTVLVSESPWQFMKASQQWLVSGAAALPCVTVSF